MALADATCDAVSRRDHAPSEVRREVGWFCVTVSLIAGVLSQRVAARRSMPHFASSAR
eukprot:CAMPEP_0113291048 /NCGR_PEP_ID=MMETSP0008_2-20120614/33801_1 /TAXON_ID=97485 /ORGANISM="Prymnesium parvum" /LENGTH=57 /DNA_ID=CAMNT_0000142855 /DNA_START=537 /DNA_END=710 /DNA_ORIENTATION=- /assembly_acc=CAM_ASM_000153